MTDVEAAFRQAASDLDAMSAEWAIIGGLAVSARAAPRFTQDVDFAVSVATNDEAEPMSEELARNVGVLAGRSGHDDIVDVSVVEGALRRGDAVVTSNMTHIRMVADAAGVRLRIESI